MNRRQRRALIALERKMTRELLGVRVAVEVCDRCGAPICPACQIETFQCDHCGGFHCEGCGSYVDPPYAN